MRDEYDFTNAKRGLLYETKAEPLRNQIKQGLAVCIKTVNADSLILRKIYDVNFLSDDLVEVVDEEKEISVYPANFFMPLSLPAEVENVLAQVTI